MTAMDMSPQRQIKDIIDLEFLFFIDASDENESAGNIRAQRDRQIYLHRIETPGGIKHALSRRTLIRLWLDQRRKENRDSGRRMLFPGDLFQDIYRFLFYSLGVLGLITGTGLALSFLSYSGIEPLNISLYLSVLIFLQIFLLAVLILFALMKYANRSFRYRSMTYRVISRFLIKSALHFKRRAMKNLSGTQRIGFETAINLVKGEKQLYGSLFYWPVFILIQIFGVGFNLGAFFSTLLRVVGSDMAFGWQSTIQFSSDAVFRLVKLIAFPWAWLVPTEIAYPSLQQIEGSRIILKDGIHHLATPDLVSWWPFLCLAVFFYGLLPRLFLLVAGWSARSAILSRLEFKYSFCDQLLHRMKTPLVSTKGRVEKSGKQPPAATSPQAGHQTDSAFGTFSTPARESILLIPDDIFDACPDDPLNDIIYRRTGFSVTGKYRIGGNDETETAVSRHLGQKDKNGPCFTVLILQEAWQPPIREFLRSIQRIRKALGPEGGMAVVLIGKPAPESILTPVKREDWNIWRNKIMAMGDPYLRIERLVENEPS